VLQGKFVLICFWAPWSIPCRKVIPDWNALQKKFTEKLVVVGVSTSTESELTQLPEPKLEFASGIDAKGKLSTAAEVTSLPCVLLVDPKGVVRYQGHPAAITETRLGKLVSSDK
jgi:cytochrome c biogenesis protein CcmG/thiol:disulfide interchange protein DsbE